MPLDRLLRGRNGNAAEKQFRAPDIRNKKRMN